MLVDVEDGTRLIIWDWRSAQVLFVRQLIYRDLTMALKHPCRTSKWGVTFLWSSSTIAGY